MFAGERSTFPAGSGRRQFDRFIAAALAQVRAEGGPRRLIFKDPTDKNLILVVGRRGASFTFKSQTRMDAETGSRHAQTITLGGIDAMTLAQARVRVEELRSTHAAAKTIEGTRKRRSAARTAAQSVEDEAARIRDVIKEAILKPGARPSEYELALLRHATLTECYDAFILHGFSKATTDRRRYDVSTHLRLAIKESDANGMLPGSLQAATISHAARKHSASTARKRVEALRVMYRWLKLYKAVDNNPAEDVPSFDPVPVRDRYADADELRRIWNACDQLQKPRADFLRLLILLPLRRGELSELRVGDIQENHGLLELRIPKERSKNKLAHALPLVGSAAEIIQSYLTAGRKKEELLIPLASEGRLFSGWTVFKSHVAKLSGCSWFYFHMTRKMFATEGVEHNLDDPSVIDGCLNHAANSGHQNYDFSRRLTRRATLLSNWERVVAEAVRTGVWPRHALASLDNVVSIGAGRSLP